MDCCLFIENIALDVSATTGHENSVLINMGDDNNSTSNDSSADTINNNTTHDQSVGEFQMVIRLLEKYLPFALLLLVKMLFDHRIGDYSF